MAISKVFYNISKSDFMNKHANKVVNDDIYAARLLVCSNVLKDAVVYGFRFDKSRKNQEIPEEKRGFVAAMDMASGIITSVVQLSIGFAISNRKFQKHICKKLFGHLSDKSPELYNVAKKGFIAAAALIGSGVIGERIIVPLIATPLATVLKNKYLQNGAKKTEQMLGNDIEEDVLSYGALKKDNKTIFSCFS